ncbi:tetratricopeptide repeat protein [Saccharopolyspora mangrovi]|uniref:Tetratricopeptide repeat protein n=1 Tax=Saccharopolyspora mangrovi TaxID=3082379 RepID=A0ABU6A3Q1_9PSEU|nr:tetratricopeptide repeat protein [Saccharopolyspora sp. S2-29]MEB3366190.1 tetratricopeptide repeat protein [Saccharopolyspora sp. S2-29]
MSEQHLGDHIEQRDVHAQRDVIGKVEQHFHPRAEVSWPCRIGRVPPAADCFRTRELSQQLVRAVGSGGTSVLTQVLSGLGGVGKTQLAREFAEQAWASREVDLLVWITATSRDEIVSGYASAAFKLQLTDAASPRDENQACQRFLEWLAKLEYRWVIVLDDVQHPRDLDELWPPRTPRGRTVVTTRRQDAKLRDSGGKLLRVGLFSEQDAVSYLSDKLDHDASKLVEASELTEDLGYLPLALSHAAAAILDRDITCATYRRRLHDSGAALAQHFPDPERDGLPDQYRNPVAATWRISIEQANDLNPIGLARPVLEFASLLDPNGIPAEVFTTDAVRAYLAERTDASVVSGEDVDTALQNLRRLSLADIAAEPAPEASQPGRRLVRVHALVQRATRDQLTDVGPMSSVAADGLIEVWPVIERDPTLGQALRASTDALRHHTHHWSPPDPLYTPEAHPVLFRAGNSRGDTGNVTAATDYYRTLTTSCTNKLGEDHPDTLTARSNLARWRGRSGDAAGAAAAFEELLADLLRVQGADHRETLTARSHLAYWRGESGDVAGAAAALEGLVADCLRVLGTDHPETLITRRNLARWRGYAGDATGAATALEELVTDDQRVLGADHPETLIVRRHLARWRGYVEDAAGAATALEDLLADFLRVLGADHPDTLKTRRNLAHWRGESGDVAGATAALEDLLADFLRVLGADHPETLITRHSLAHWRGHFQ